MANFKFFPPSISEVLPAMEYCYERDSRGTVSDYINVKIPFEDNASVPLSGVDYIVKIKTVQGVLIEVIKDCIVERESASSKKGVISFGIFEPNDIKKYNIGQSYKFQLAYVDTTTQVTGYYSSNGVAKLTTRPFIDAIVNNNEEIVVSYIQQGRNEIYTSGQKYDVTEKLHSSFFEIKHKINDDEYKTIYSSDEKLHNVSEDESQSISKEYFDIQDPKLLQAVNQAYSEDKKILDYLNPKENEGADIQILINYFKEYYQIIFNYTTKNNLINVENLSDDLRLGGKVYLILLSLTSKFKINNIPIYQMFEESGISFEVESNFNSGNIEIKYRHSLIKFNDVDIYFYKRDYLNTEFDLVHVLKSSSPYTNYSIVDINVEYGEVYNYYAIPFSIFKNLSNTLDDDMNDATFLILPDFLDLESDSSQKFIKSIIKAEFEDMFLYDETGRILPIKFNPNVSSFKTVLQEQKVETIGGKYPYIFLNGQIGYKEFPISGLISYYMDSENIFKFSLKNKFNFSFQRTKTSYKADIEDELDSLFDDVYIERKFREEVLEWLNNGKIKYLKTPTEGNFLVRLMGVNLTPMAGVNRKMYTFSANVEEVNSISYKHLEQLNLLPEHTIIVDN